jgi:hypothetical protein
MYLSHLVNLPENDNFPLTMYVHKREDKRTLQVRQLILNLLAPIDRNLSKQRSVEVLTLKELHQKNIMGLKNMDNLFVTF